jgi:hypothetical protein
VARGPRCSIVDCMHTLSVDYLKAKARHPEVFGLSLTPDFTTRSRGFLRGSQEAWIAYLQAHPDPTLRQRYELQCLRAVQGVEADARRWRESVRLSEVDECIYWEGPPMVCTHALRHPAPARGARNDRTMTAAQMTWLLYRAGQHLPGRIGRTCNHAGCVNPEHLK